MARVVKTAPSTVRQAASKPVSRTKRQARTAQVAVIAPNRRGRPPGSTNKATSGKSRIQRAVSARLQGRAVKAAGNPAPKLSKIELEAMVGKMTRTIARLKLQISELRSSAKTETSSATSGVDVSKAPTATRKVMKTRAVTSKIGRAPRKSKSAGVSASASSETGGHQTEAGFEAAA